jgi:hypothetical protein
MSQHWKLHECEKLPDVGIRIHYSMDNIHRGKKIWRLTIQREATENDLLDSHLFEEEGETIWETSLEITHCPYCGKYLYDDENIQFEDVGRFVHFDYSEWKSKMK